MKFVDQAREPGAKIGAWTANGGPNQLWQFEPASGAGGSGLEYGHTPYGQPQQHQYVSPQQPGHQHAGASTHRFKQ